MAEKMKKELNKLKTHIKYLFNSKYKNSICPRKTLARDLNLELLKIGIPPEDHLIFIINIVD